MLSKHAIIAAAGIADNLAYSGKVLTASGLLGVVTDKSLPPLESFELTSLVVGGDTELTPIQELMFARASTAMGGIDNHTLECDNLISALTEITEGSLSYAKGVIAPRVREILEEAEKTRSTLSSGISDFTLIPTGMADVYREDVLRQMFEPYVTGVSSNKLGDTATYALFNALTEERLTAALTTGIGTFDYVLKEFLVGAGSDTFKEFLAYGSDLVKTPHVLGPIGEADVFGKHSTLLIFLFLDGVVNGRLPDVDINDFEPLVTQEILSARGYFGRALDQLIKRMESLLANNAITLPYSSDYRYYVNARTYSQWLKNTPGASLGVYLMHRKEGYRVRDEAEKLADPTYIESMNKRWEAYNLTRKLSLDVRFSTMVTDLVRKAVIGIINEDNDLDIGEKVKRIKALNTELDASPYRTFMPLNVFVRKMVCLAYDKANDSAKLLAIMEEYMRKEPEASPNLAAVIACVDLLVEWHMKSITIDKL